MPPQRIATRSARDAVDRQRPIAIGDGRADNPGAGEPGVDDPVGPGAGQPRIGAHGPVDEREPSRARPRLGVMRAQRPIVLHDLALDVEWRVGFGCERCAVADIERLDAVPRQRHSVPHGRSSGLHTAARREPAAEPAAAARPVDRVSPQSCHQAPIGSSHGIAGPPGATPRFPTRRESSNESLPPLRAPTARASFTAEQLPSSRQPLAAWSSALPDVAERPLQIRPPGPIGCQSRGGRRGFLPDPPAAGPGAPHSLTDSADLASLRFGKQDPRQPDQGWLAGAEVSLDHPEAAGCRVDRREERTGHVRERHDRLSRGERGQAPPHRLVDAGDDVAETADHGLVGDLV